MSSKKNMKDLWGDDSNNNNKKNEEWKLSCAKTAEKRKEWTPRSRPPNPSKPNHKAAVALPHAGQSYHPADDAHQDALRQAAKNLERKKKADEAWIKKMSLKDKAYKGDLKSDNNWKDVDEDDALTGENGELLLGEKASIRSKPAREMKRSEKLEEKKKKIQEIKKKHGKKLSKSELAERKKHALKLKRQPNQVRKLRDADRVEEIADEVGAEMDHSTRLTKYRKALKKKDQTTVAFGRHHHQPLALEVAPTQALTGSLRQLLNGRQGGANAVVHPLVDRVKSLEARNMIPARMRHQYNKKKEVIAPGEVKILREPFGIMPQD